jgi:adenylate/nucleoside-diphosphate kinase
MSEILQRVQNIIDPFYLKQDEESNVRLISDVAEGTYGHIPFGDYADYCPVTLKRGNWLI